MAAKDERNWFGRHIKAVRNELGYTREQIAERANIGWRYLSAIENEEKTPKADIVFSIIRATGVSADRIVYPEQEMAEDECARLVRLLRNCSEQDRKVVTAMIDAMIDAREQEEGIKSEDG